MSSTVFGVAEVDGEVAVIARVDVTLGEEVSEGLRRERRGAGEGGEEARGER